MGRRSERSVLRLGGALVADDVALDHVHNIFGDVRCQIGDSFEVTGYAENLDETFRLIGRTPDTFLDRLECLTVHTINLVIQGDNFICEFGIQVHEENIPHAWSPFSFIQFRAGLESALVNLMRRKHSSGMLRRNERKVRILLGNLEARRR
jgi:hypothetical protein